MPQSSPERTWAEKTGETPPATNAGCPIQAVLWLEWDNGSRCASSHPTNNFELCSKPKLCHPACSGVPWERSRGTCSALCPLATAGCPIQAVLWLEWDNGSRRASPNPTNKFELCSKPKLCHTACRGSEAEGPAVRPSPSQLPKGTSGVRAEKPQAKSSLRDQPDRRGKQPKPIICGPRSSKRIPQPPTPPPPRPLPARAAQS